MIWIFRLCHLFFSSGISIRYVSFSSFLCGSPILRNISNRFKRIFRRVENKHDVTNFSMTANLVIRMKQCVIKSESVSGTALKRFEKVLTASFWRSGND